MNHLPFAGLMLNTHGELLPIPELQALGVKGVRADFAEGITLEKVRAVLAHYPMPVYFTLGQGEKDVAAAGAALVKGGAKDIGLYNEPDLAKITPADYAQAFRTLRRVVGHGVRLYGPCVSKYNPSYVLQCIRSGMQADAIDIHGYYALDLAMMVDLVSCQTKLPVISGEDSIVNDAGGPGSEDPEVIAAWFKARVAQMGDRPWVYYDGVGSGTSRVEPRGLFDWDDATGTWSAPSAAYRAIVPSSTLGSGAAT